MKNRSSTPISMPAKMTGNDGKTSDVYLNILKQRRAIKLLNRQKDRSTIETPRNRKPSTPRSRTSDKEMRRKSSSRD